MTEINSHPYRTEIPNIVDDMGLSVYAYRLYGHLKRVAGDDGTCWQSTETLAEACGMSKAMVSKVKDELTKKRLIKITEEKLERGGRAAHHITIVDIWSENFQKFAGRQPEEGASSPHEQASSPHEQASSPHEQASSPHEQASSPHEQASSLSELKKNPIKKNPIKNVVVDEKTEQAGPKLSEDEKNFLSAITEMFGHGFANVYQPKKILTMGKKFTQETTLKALEYYAMGGVELGEAIRRADRALPTWKNDLPAQPANGSRANGYQKPESAQARAMREVQEHLAMLQAQEAQAQGVGYGD